MLEKYLNLENHIDIKRGVLDLFKKNPEKELVHEVSALKKKTEKLEKGLGRLEKLEQALAQNEVVLAKKIADMNRFEEELGRLVQKEEIEKLREELKRFDQHEELLAENAKFMRELVQEVGKVKDSHKLTRKEVISKQHVSKNECEERFSIIKEALEDLEHIRKTHRGKAGHHDLANLKQELHDRLSQLEYQNKLLMSYLKKVDEILKEKA